MRKPYLLSSQIYLPRYEELYQLLFNADLDEIHDFSEYCSTKGKYYVHYPLFLIVRSSKINKRLEIRHFTDIKTKKNPNPDNSYGISVYKNDLYLFDPNYYKDTEYYHPESYEELLDIVKRLLKECL